MRISLFFLRAVVAGLALSASVALLACGGALPGGDDEGDDVAHHDGGGSGAGIASDFPVGVLTACSSSTWLGGDTGSLAGGGRFAVAESGGVVTVTPEEVDGSVGGAPLTFEVTTRTTALARSGQSFFDPSLDGGEPVALAAGALALVDGTFVVSLAGDSGQAEWIECTVPYAACDSTPADAAASLPSGEYDQCVTSNGASPLGTVTLTRSGGTVTAELSDGLLYTGVDSSVLPDGGWNPTFEFTVVAPGIATIRPDAPGGSVPVCGSDGEHAVLLVDGDSLFLSGGHDWLTGDITCTASHGTAALPPSAAVDASVPDGAALAATESGRTVHDCSACEAGEFCVTETFQGDECFRSDGGQECMSGTHWDAPASCCEVDPWVTTTCWPDLPSCAGGLTCDCASGVVNLACEGEPWSCDVVDGGIACETGSG